MEALKNNKDMFLNREFNMFFSNEDNNLMVDSCFNGKFLMNSLLDEIYEFSKDSEEYFFNKNLLQYLGQYGRETSFKQLIDLLKVSKRNIINEFMNKNILESKLIKYIITCNDFFDKLEEKCYDNYYNNSYSMLHVDEITSKLHMLIFTFSNNEFKYMNSASEEFMGYTLDELNNKGIYNLCSKEYLSDLKNILKDEEINEPVHLEIKLKDKQEKYKWLHLSTLNFNVAGEHYKLLMGIDITYKKLIENEIKNSEKRYKEVLEFIPDPVVICVKGRIEYANKAALNLVNKKQLKDVEGRSCFDYISINKNIKKKLIHDIKELENKSESDPIVVRTKRNDDKKIFYLETKAVSMTYEGNKAVLGILRDVTQKKRMERLEKKFLEKTLLLKQARELDKIKSEIFGNISHEIRTPLNIIFSVNQLMSKLSEEEAETKIKDTKLKEYIGMSSKNSYRILRLVNNIIDLSRVELGYMPMELKSYNIVEVIEEITTAVANFLQYKDITVIFDTNVEEKIMCFDLEKIKRVMLNLLSNSIKFSSKGGEILVTLKAQKKNVKISVKDNGVGIPKDKQEEIFDAFTRVDRSFTRMAEGTGIGLSVVSAFVRLHGGNVYVNSEYGVGSEFIIEIPCVNYDFKQENTIYNFNFEEEKDILNVEFSDIYN